MGTRVGPNKVSIGGVLQPITDALKLSNKQVSSLLNYSFFYYFVRCTLMLFSARILWNFLFCSPSRLSWGYVILCLIIILGLNSLNSIFCGWRRFRKYSLVGSLRTVSQLVSYESVLYFCLFFFVYRDFSFRAWRSREGFLFIIAPICVLIWFPAFLAELNRTPYDFSEGERELVRGFNTEFGSNSFTLIFLAEYANILFFCRLNSFLFFQDLFYSSFFFFFFFVLWIRRVLPRFRFDKLMSLAWKTYIPIITIYFLVYVCFLF